MAPGMDGHSETAAAELLRKFGKIYRQQLSGIVTIKLKACSRRIECTFIFLLQDAQLPGVRSRPSFMTPTQDWGEHVKATQKGPPHPDITPRTV